ncbi:hypothetical protein FOWG_10838 [Fusarium oxysporum f. sp. lycopersici MN25]|nr:hypothetical protein FOWG_10838 [Fusarium oxysporum f. sp. lycopersici MN25]
MNPAFSNIIHVSKPGAFRTVLFIAVNQLGGLKKFVLTDPSGLSLTKPNAAVDGQQNIPKDLYMMIG